MLVCAGSGGVGKTTVAASLSLRAAEIGKNVLVLTVDPSKRLASALGLELKQSQETRVSLGTEYKGSLHAAVIQSKEVFDQFIATHSNQPEIAERITGNRLYQQMSTTLAGSQEFTSLERLLQAVESGRYELIVLDTPPTKHAMDFFMAPEKINSLFQDAITRWFMAPGERPRNFVSALLNRGTRTVLKSLEGLTGAPFIEELIEFFSAVRSIQRVIRDRGLRVSQVLRDSKTSFVVVTSFDNAKILEAESLKDQLVQMGFTLQAVVINRAFPAWMPKGSAPMEMKSSSLANSLSQNHQILQKYFAQFCQYYSARYRFYESFAAGLDSSVDVIRIPEFPRDIFGLEDLKFFARRMADHALNLALVVAVAATLGCSSLSNSGGQGVSAVSQATSKDLKPPQAFLQALESLQAQKYELARQKFEDFLRQNPATRWTQRSLFHLGESFEGLTRWSEAVETYRSVIHGSVAAPDLRAMALYRLSYCYEALGDDGLTVASLLDTQKWRENLPAEVARGELPARLAAAYARVGRFDEALKHYKRAEGELVRLRQERKQKNSSGPPEWLAKTLYHMGRFPEDRISWADFDSLMNSFQRTQVYLFQAAELDVSPWSQRAASELIGLYKKFWMVTERPPDSSMPSESILGKRQLQKAQWSRAHWLLERIVELRALQLPEAIPSTLPTQEVYAFVDDLEKTMGHLLSQRPWGEGLTPEASQRRFRIRGRVIDPDDSLEKSFVPKDQNQ